MKEMQGLVVGISVNNRYDPIGYPNDELDDDPDDDPGDDPGDDPDDDPDDELDDDPNSDPISCLNDDYGGLWGQISLPPKE